MDRRAFLVGSTVVLALPGCVGESDMVRYAKIAGVAAGSIGQILEKSHPELGQKIITAANALIAAAEQWSLTTDTESLLVSSLQALKTLLESIPGEVAQQTATLIPIVLAAIQAIFAMIPQSLASPSLTRSENTVWHATNIPHHFGYAREKDFRIAWDEAAKSVPGAVIFK